MRPVWWDGRPEGEPVHDFGAVRIVTDPLEGTLLAVGGDAPLVARLYPPTRALGQFDYEHVDGECTDPATAMWPTVVPSEMHGYRAVLLVPVTALRDVDVLRVLSGAAYQRSNRAGYYLWQAATGRLWLLTEGEVRAALASRWFRHMRGDGEAPVRAIRLQR